MKYLLILLTFLLLGGCVSSDESVSGQLKLQTWKLIELDGEDVSAVGGELSFIEALQMSGNNGCNRFFGSARIEKGHLITGNTGMTRKFCGELRGVVEQAFMATLASQAEVTVQGEDMQLKGAHSLVFKRIE